jgi:hypothetical protein
MSLRPVAQLLHGLTLRFVANQPRPTRRLIGSSSHVCLAWIPKEAKLTNNLASRRSELSEDSRLALFGLVIAWRE